MTAILSKSTYNFWGIIILVNSLLSSCAFREEELALTLPPFESKLVVESYVQPDSFFRVSLTRNIDYFSPPSIEQLLKYVVDSALVTISYQNKTDTLPFRPIFSPGNYYLYGEYRSKTRVPRDYNTDFVLKIKYKDKEVTGRTKIMPPVKIDSVVYKYNTATNPKASVRLYWQDPDPNTTNYFRFLIRNPKDTVSRSQLNVELNDRVQAGTQGFIATGFNFERKDSIRVRFLHISEAYYKFIESTERATAANITPLSEPTSLKSTVSGDGIGVFTGFDGYDRWIRFK